MLTAYDHTLASLVDRAGVDIILVGDSLANVILGLESTVEVDLQTMLRHARAVRRAVSRAMVVGDMPFVAYQVNPREAVTNARRFVEEAGCEAVKVEWFDGCPDVTRDMVSAGIPVMGHVGLTPQRARELGGLRLQGKDADTALAVIQQAEALQEAGCFSVVLECVPAVVARIITSRLRVPTIGIGAGPDCDGQVLVLHDLLGLTAGRRPKFVKAYARLAEAVVAAIREFGEDVRQQKFPAAAQTYQMSSEERARLKQMVHWEE